MLSVLKFFYSIESSGGSVYTKSHRLSLHMLHIIMLQTSSLPIYFVNNNKIKSWLGQFKNLLQELDKSRRRVHAASNRPKPVTYTLQYK